MNTALAQAIKDWDGLSSEEIQERTRNSHILDIGAAVDLLKNYYKYRNLMINTSMRL